MRHTWKENLHFWYCDLCQKYFKYNSNKILIEVDPDEELKKEWNEPS